jgi:hypothetical protein
MMHKIGTIYWQPGCMVHLPGSYSSDYFVVVLHVDVISWKILAYTLRFSDQLGSVYKPPLIDTLHPYRFWLWQAERGDLHEHTDSSVLQARPTRLEFDYFGPFSVVRKLPQAKVHFLANRLMKAFYDLSSWHLGYLYSPIRIPNALLLQRIDSAIEYANGFSLPGAN